MVELYQLDRNNDSHYHLLMNLKNKTCEVCLKGFKPTSGTQKRCGPCGRTYVRNYKKEHRIKNKQRYNELHRNWVKENKEIVVQYKKNWRENNKERDRELNLNLYYKHREKRKIEMISRSKARSMLKKTLCLKCGSIEKLNIHHIDGNCLNNNKQNLIVLCRKCHLLEHKK